MVNEKEKKCLTRPFIVQSKKKLFHYVIEFVFVAVKSDEKNIIKCQQRLCDAAV